VGKRLKFQSTFDIVNNTTITCTRRQNLLISTAFSLYKALSMIFCVSCLFRLLFRFPVSVLVLVSRKNTERKLILHDVGHTTADEHLQ